MTHDHDNVTEPHEVSDHVGDLTRFSLNRRITVFVLFITTIVVGAIAAIGIPLELIPRGFNNPFRIEYQAVNLDTIDESGLDAVDPEILHSRGLIHKGAFVKVLGRGSLSRSVTVKAHAFSKSAEAAITGAGGTVEVLPKPFGVRPSHGSFNQHTNR